MPRVWRAKWICDGARSIDEMADMLLSEAENLRRLKGQGWELEDVVEDDYAYLTRRKKSTKPER